MSYAQLRGVDEKGWVQFCLLSQHTQVVDIKEAQNVEIRGSGSKELDD